MNGFEKHGITYSSPSSINMYAAAPCAWVAKYLFNKKFRFGLAAKAGLLVEDAVASVLLDGVPEEDAIKKAVSEYNKASAFGASSSEVSRGEGIPGMIQGALEELKPYGAPEMPTDIIYGKKQRKIELLCNGDGWKLPVIGYLDFYFPAHGLIVDLKTSLRCPSSLSDEHARQGAIYRAAVGNSAMKFLYVTPKKTTWLEVEDHVPVLAEVKAILNRQERMLRLDKEVIRDIVPVNASSFYWSGDTDMRKELYDM